MDNGDGQGRIDGNMKPSESFEQFRTDARSGNTVSAEIILLVEQEVRHDFRSTDLWQRWAGNRLGCAGGTTVSSERE